MEPYAVLSIRDTEPIAVAGVLWTPIRRTLGIDAFGINAYTAAAVGDHVVEPHNEETLGHQEAYVVIAGRAMFSLGDEELDAPSGTVVFVRDPSVQRQAVAVEAGTVVLAIGGVPGTHAPSAWEWYFEAEKHRAGGDNEAALALLAEGREAFPEHGGHAVRHRLLGGDGRKSRRVDRSIARRDRARATLPRVVEGRCGSRRDPRPPRLAHLVGRGVPRPSS